MFTKSKPIKDYRTLFPINRFGFHASKRTLPVSKAFASDVLDPTKVLSPKVLIYLGWRGRSI